MHYSMPISQRLKKLIKSLHQKQFRDQNGLFIAEGEKLTEELLNSSYNAELIVIKDSPNSNVLEFVDKFVDKGVAIYTAPKHQFDQICDAKSPQSILSVVSTKESELNKDLPFLVLDNISDPGNLGTIIRTADWFGINQILLGTESADCYNPKAVRSTMGSIFKSTVKRTDNLIDYIKDNFKNHKLYGATLHSEKYLEDLTIKDNKFGIVFGSEAHGITKNLEESLDIPFKIRGNGHAESLNVAIAAGITLYHFSKFN